MRATLANFRKLLGVLAWGAALGCSDNNEPPSKLLHLSIQGEILSTDPTPVPVAGAVVNLKVYDLFDGGWEFPTVADATTDQAGNYQLTYIIPLRFTCSSSEQADYWIEVTAAGYDTKSTYTLDNPHSEPPIDCTSEPQVIDLSLDPLGWLQLITNTTGPGLDPDGYEPFVTGRFPYPWSNDMSFGYTMGMNAEQIVALIPGQFTLELTEVAGNCTVAGDNLRTITVPARDTVASTFEVTCAS